MHDKDLETLGRLRALGKGLSEIYGDLEVRGLLFLGPKDAHPDTTLWSEADAGCIWYLTTTNSFYYWNGASISSFGGWTLLYSNEADGSTYSNTAAETTVYTSTLAPNSYSYILIDTIVFASDNRDVTGKVDWSLRIKYDGADLKQFDARTLASSASGANSGEMINIHGTYIMAGGQTVSKDITVTFQASVANASVSFRGKMCRIWGIP